MSAENTIVTPVHGSDETETTFAAALKELENLGLSRKRQSIKLLLATKGDVQAVTHFLKVKQMIRNANKQAREERRKLQVTSTSNNNSEAPTYKTREERRAERELRRNQRKEGKLLEKKPRQHRHHGRERKPREQLDIVTLKLNSKENWPTDPIHLYLDGNNMLFVLEPLRALILKARKVREAEEILANFAKQFAQMMKVDHCTVIFDDTNKDIKEEHFTVCSARPTFQTSDDALVEWSTQTKEKPGRIFVTSDVGLIKRLKDTDAIICKPKEWFNFAAKVIQGNDNAISSLDDWMRNWIATK